VPVKKTDDGLTGDQASIQNYPEGIVNVSSFRGPARDLRVGVHHGAYCVACCWGLMIVLIAVGAMNIAVMAALAVVILIEKVWKYGHPLSLAVGGVLYRRRLRALAPVAPARPPHVYVKDPLSLLHCRAGSTRL